MIYKNNGKGGFAIGTNRFSREDLAAGGIAAVALAAMAVIGGLGKPKKARKKGAVVRLLSAPLLFRLAKSGVSKINLEALAKKARSGENVSTFFTNSASEEEDSANADISNDSAEISGDDDSELEVIESTPIASEDEVYEHI